MWYKTIQAMKPIYTLPLIISLLLLLLLAIALVQGKNPPITTSAFKTLPDFSLPDLDNNTPFTPEDLKGKYSLINIFASWCSACLTEHPELLQLRDKLPVYGIAWRDTPANTKKMLDTYGNPYTKIGSDKDSTAIIALGVSGAPESFLVSPEGNIIFHYPGVLTKDIIENEILVRVK